MRKFALDLALNNEPSTLTNCDVEPVHTPGAVQGHGMLLAASLDDLTVTHVSANCATFTGLRPEEMLGVNLLSLLQFSSDALDWPQQLAGQDANGEQPWRSTVEALVINGHSLMCWAHSTGGLLLLELTEQDMPSSTLDEQQRMRQRAVAELNKPTTVNALCEAAVLIFRLFTGFDRVLVYRFHPDWHGEVVAEHTDLADRFLGLHYPASDIPATARRNYRLNLIRSISDTNAQTWPVLTLKDHKRTADPLDMTYSKLRAVSPVHIRYMHNMGVTASMSVSILVEGRLWGMVACHHQTPRSLSVAQLHFCELLGEVLSTFIERTENAERLQRFVAVQDLAARMERGRTHEHVAELLQALYPELCQLLDIDGIVVSFDGKRSGSGTLPDEPIDFRPLGAQAEGGVVLTDHLAEHIALSAAQAEAVAGCVYLAMGSEGEDYVVFTRRDHVEVVNWAGTPNKPERRGADGLLHLEPRDSFARWQQTVRGRSRPFGRYEMTLYDVLRRTFAALRAAERERSAIQAQRAAEMVQANLRLELLYSARLSSMGELASGLAHELNQPLTAVINYVSAFRAEVMANDYGMSEDLVVLLDEAADQAERAGQIVRRLRGFIERGDLERRELTLNEVLEEAVALALSATFGQEVEVSYDIDADLPRVFADRVQIEQVVFNLVRNAFEAMQEATVKRLCVAAVWCPTGECTTIDGVCVSITDSGPGLSAEALDSLFQPFNTSKQHGMGIGLSLCRSVIEAHGGKIWARNHPDGGAEFTFVLPANHETGVK